MRLKNWKEIRKDVAGLERSIKDEKVRTELWWHARIRTRTRFFDVFHLHICQNWGPAINHFWTHL